MKSKTIVTILFSIVVISGVLLRLYHLGFGLPFELVPDERGIVVSSLLVASEGDPHWYYYGSFSFYLNAFLFGLYYCVGSVLNWFSGMDGFLYHISLKNLEPLLLISRSVSALCGCFMIFLCYKTGRLFSRNIAWLATIFISINYMMIVRSHTGKVEMLSMFLSTLSLFYILKWLQTPEQKPSYAIALFAGLAFATKFNECLPFILFCFVYVYKQYRESTSLTKALFDSRLLKMIFLTSAVFLLSSPFMWIHFQDAWPQMREVLFKAGQSKETTFLTGRIHTLTTSLPLAMGSFAYILAIIALFMSFFSQSSILKFISAYTLIVMILPGGKEPPVYYCLNAILGLTILTSIFIENCVSWVNNSLGWKKWTLMTFFLAMICMPEAFRLIHFTHLLKTPVTYQQFKSWVENRVPAGTKIALPMTSQVVTLNPDRKTIKKMISSVETRDQSHQNQGAHKGAAKRYKIIMQKPLPKPQYQLLDSYEANYERGRLNGSDYRVSAFELCEYAVIYQDALLGKLKEPPADIKTILANKFRHIKTFQGPPENHDNHKEMVLDWVFPYKDFHLYRALGPKISVYKKI